MARIYTRTLGMLDRLFDFATGESSAPLEFSCESPIQPVHDVSRECELGRIVTNPFAGGIYSLDQDNVHAAGGDTVDSFLDPYGTLDPAWGVVDGRWVWLLKYAGSVSSTAIIQGGAAAAISVNMPSLPNAYTRRDFHIQSFSGANTIATSLSATFPASMVAGQTGAAPGLTEGVRMPFPLPPGALIGWHTVATAAVPGTMRLECLCWIGPLGVYPPGMF